MEQLFYDFMMHHPRQQPSKLKRRATKVLNKKDTYEVSERRKTDKPEKPTNHVIRYEINM